MKILLVLLLLLPFQAISAEEKSPIKNRIIEEPFLQVTYFAYASHKLFLDEDKYNLNNKLNMFSVAYRNQTHGAELTSFTNSYYVKSYALSYAHYWQPVKNIEASVNVGYVSGYSETSALFAASVAYTKYDYFIPKVTWFGEALVFSLSFNYRF